MNTAPSIRFRQEPKEFSFPQWIRIWLRERLKAEGGSHDLLSLLDDGLDIRHSGSIGFAPQDIANLGTSHAGREELRVHFMGLQGASSPLPSYLVDPLQKSDDHWAPLRSFYRIFENRTYRLFALAILLRSPWIRCEFMQADPLETHLRQWAGCQELKDERAASRRLGGFSQLVPNGRSREGLKRFLSQQLDSSSVSVDDSAPAWIQNPAPAILGEFTLDGGVALGEHIPMGGEHLDVRLGPLPWDTYRIWSRDPQAARDLVGILVDDFLPRPLDWEGEVVLDPSTVPARAGRHLGDGDTEAQASLGTSAWLGELDLEPARLILA